MLFRSEWATLSSAALFAVLATLSSSHAAAGEGAAAAPDQVALDAFLASFQPKFDEILADDDARAEMGAVYVGVSHPLIGDQTFLGLEANSTDDHWGIGSLSKTFVATLILLYVEEGRLSLDDTIPELLPDLDTSGAYGNVTLFQTLTMTTGVPDFLNDPDGLLADLFENPDKNFTTQDIVDGAVAAHPVDPPGREFNYSSTGYVLLQDIAEGIGGKPAHELYAERLYAPLGMSNGSTVLPPRNSRDSIPFPRAEAHDTPGCIEDFEEYGYDPAAHGIGVGDPITNTLSPAVNVAGAAGSMYTVLGDMLLWTKSGQGNSLLRPETAAMRSELFSWEEGRRRYGYGMGLYSQGSGYLGHSGEAFGYESLSAHNPTDEASFFVASTSCGAGMHHFALFQAFVAALEETKAAMVNVTGTNGTIGSGGGAESVAAGTGTNGTIGADGGGDGSVPPANATDGGGTDVSGTAEGIDATQDAGDGASGASGISPAYLTLFLSGAVAARHLLS